MVDFRHQKAGDFMPWRPERTRPRATVLSRLGESLAEARARLQYRSEMS